MLDPVKEAITSGKTRIDIKSAERPLVHTILGQPFRDYFIKRVKAPFLKAVIFYSKKYPLPTKKNCSGRWTEPFMDALDKLVEYVQYRKDFFTAVRRIVLGEIEHDTLYRDPILFILEELVEAILDGRIPAREEGRPPREYWGEPPPYGGKNTVIGRIITHRKAINDILGREHKEAL